MLFRRVTGPLLAVVVLLASLLGPSHGADAVTYPANPTAQIPTVSPSGAGWTVTYSASPGTANPQPPGWVVELRIDGVNVDEQICPANALSCGGAYLWNGGTAATHTLTTVIVFMDSYGVDITEQGSPQTFVSTGAGVIGLTPTVAITLPGGATVAGTVDVTLTASVPATQTGPRTNVTEIGLTLAGRVIPVPACIDPTTCQVVVAVNTYGNVNGPAALVATATTDQHTSGTATQNLTLANPSPAVAITSPSSGATLAYGVTTVTVSAAAVPGTTDNPATVTLYAGSSAPSGAPVGTLTCTGAPSCAGTITWTPFNYGVVTLVAEVTTGLGNVAIGNPVAVTFAPSGGGPGGGTPAATLPGTVVDLDSVPTLRSGRTASIIGYVARRSDSVTLPGAVVNLTLTPAVGARTVRTLTADSTGKFKTSFTATVNTKVTVAFAGDSADAPSIASEPVLVTALTTCHVTAGRVRANRTDSLHCTVSQLPKGTTLTVRYYDHGWFVVPAHRATGPAVKLGFSLDTPGAAKVELLISAGKVFADTTSAPVKVTVLR
jgi:hypothetical protein